MALEGSRETDAHPGHRSTSTQSEHRTRLLPSRPPPTLLVRKPTVRAHFILTDPAFCIANGKAPFLSFGYRERSVCASASKSEPTSWGQPREWTFIEFSVKAGETDALARHAGQALRA